MVRHLPFCYLSFDHLKNTEILTNPLLWKIIQRKILFLFEQKSEKIIELTCMRIHGELISNFLLGQKFDSKGHTKRHLQQKGFC